MNRGVAALWAASMIAAVPAASAADAARPDPPIAFIYADAVGTATDYDIDAAGLRYQTRFAPLRGLICVSRVTYDTKSSWTAIVLQNYLPPFP